MLPRTRLKSSQSWKSTYRNLPFSNFLCFWQVFVMEAMADPFMYFAPEIFPINILDL